MEGKDDLVQEPWERYASYNEWQMMKAVACAFYRSCVIEFRAEAYQIRESDVKLLPDLINNVRRCLSPDERHPCRHCMTEVFHERGDAVEHLFECSQESIVDLDIEWILTLLYSRAVDRSLFRTTATDRCGGHFGLCRNLPRAGDDVVILPGLPNPVVLRRRAANRPGEVDTFSVVGVTTGMLGPPVLDQAGNEVKGDYCIGTCPEMASLSGREPRSFYLI